jgi:quinoprotein glucose dehydrogenase
VSQLQVAWTYPVTGTIVFNPIVVTTSCTCRAPATRSWPSMRATGKEIWTHPNQGAIGARGLNYWESPDRSDRRLIISMPGNITAIDAGPGQTITSFGDQRPRRPSHGALAGRRNPLQTSNPGRIFDDIIIMSLPAQGAGYEANPADVQALRRPHRQGAVGVPHHPAARRVRLRHLARRRVQDRRRRPQLVRADGGRREPASSSSPTGTGRFDFYGGNRHGSEPVRQQHRGAGCPHGKRLWHQQLVHHDLWDFDLPQAPKLLTLRQNGRTIEAVGAGDEDGFVFVFERKTGRPRSFPIEERPVPQTDVPGRSELAHAAVPDQAGAVRAPDVHRERTSIRSLPPGGAGGDAAEAAQLAATKGLYTPPSLRGSVSDAGHNGGANWGSGAGGSRLRGEMYIVSKNMPVMLRSCAATRSRRPAARWAVDRRARSSRRRRSEADCRGEGRARQGAGALYVALRLHAQPDQRDDRDRPPWSQLTAYDLNTGEIKWQVPDGGVTPPPGANVNYPGDSGSHMPRGGPLVTAGGLVFVADGVGSHGARLRSDNGKVVWKTDLPTGSEGVPASYEVNGRQFIVFPVAAGTGGFSIRWGGPVPRRARARRLAVPKARPRRRRGAAAAAAPAGRRRFKGRTSPTRCPQK